MVAYLKHTLNFIRCKRSNSVVVDLRDGQDIVLVEDPHREGSRREDATGATMGYQCCNQISLRCCLKVP